MKNGREESENIPDFPNDQMTDSVIHQEHQPGIDDGGIINESEKLQEDIPAIHPVNTSKGPDDCWFPIHFNYAGIDHTADVLKKEGTITEYHVTAVLPGIDHLPDPFIVASTLSKGAYDFPVNETYYPRELGLIIKQAIGSGCDHNDVALA